MMNVFYGLVLESPNTSRICWTMGMAITLALLMHDDCLHFEKTDHPLEYKFFVGATNTNEFED